MRVVLLILVVVFAVGCGAKQNKVVKTESEPVAAAPSETEDAEFVPAAAEPVVYKTGNTSETAIEIVPAATSQTIDNIKLTPEANEFWASLDQEGGYTYHFYSTGGSDQGEVNAVVHGPPKMKVHKKAEDNGGNGAAFEIIYPETKDNPHFLKVWLVSGEEWTGNVVYSKEVTP